MIGYSFKINFPIGAVFNLKAKNKKVVLSGTANVEVIRKENSTSIIGYTEYAHNRVENS